MRKIHVIFLICMLFSIVLLLFACQESKKKYPSGRDTYKAFGDGRFQICGDNESYVLIDNEAQDIIIDGDIYRYRRIKEHIYVVGQCGYSVVNFESGEVIQSQNLSELPEEYVEIFNNVDKFKIFEDKK